MRSTVRRWLGITELRHRLTRMENTMSQLSDQLNQANDTLDGLKTDVQVILDRASIPAEDTEAQAAADRLTQFAQSWRSSTPDADGSDTPTNGEPGTDQQTF